MSRSTAKATALKFLGNNVTRKNVSAFAVSGGKGYFKNRPIWVVVLPNQMVHANLGPGQGTAPPVRETVVVFIDADTGLFLRSATV